ncbi:MAG: histidinol-phosphate transaminase [Dokdonella sp.]
MNLLDLARPEILALKPYSSARLEAGTGEVMLNANEAPWPPPGVPAGVRAAPLNRYPDPQPRILVERLAQLYAVDPSQVLVGRGSDEAIDLLTRAFCRPGRDAIAISPPTFGMYAVCAAIQGAEIIEVPLKMDFTTDSDALIASLPANVKLIFLCTPNNPTGAAMPIAEIERIALAMRDRALVIVDEAYVEFADTVSATTLISRHANLGVLRTLSKAWALAGARIGVLLGAAELIALLRRIMPPYPLPSPCVAAALAALTADGLALTLQRTALLVAERERMAAELVRLPGVVTVLPSSANFLCVKFVEAAAAYRKLLASGVVVRDVGRYPRLAEHLRISIGTREENTRVLDVLIRQELSA